jgi:hypothetical protein
MLFVEFSGDNVNRIHEALDEVNAKHKPLLAAIHTDKDEIELAWAFRSRSVGLLSSMKGTSTPVPFVEDRTPRTPCGLHPSIQITAQ